jgi:hypothetical protein
MLAHKLPRQRTASAPTQDDVRPTEVHPDPEPLAESGRGPCVVDCILVHHHARHRPRTGLATAPIITAPAETGEKPGSPVSGENFPCYFQIPMGLYC